MRDTCCVTSAWMTSRITEYASRSTFYALFFLFPHSFALSNKSPKG
jgi:hypothetical protein